MLLHLVDGTGEDPAEAYRVIRDELAAYGHGLDEKPEVVALSKADALTPAARTAKAKALAKAAGRKPLILSAVSGEGVEQALKHARPRDRRRGRGRPERGAGGDRGGVAAVGCIAPKSLKTITASRMSEVASMTKQLNIRQ